MAFANAVRFNTAVSAADARLANMSFAAKITEARLQRARERSKWYQLSEEERSQILFPPPRKIHFDYANASPEQTRQVESHFQGEAMHWRDDSLSHSVPTAQVAINDPDNPRHKTVPERAHRPWHAGDTGYGHQHVDHGLELFRQQAAMGGYRFDGTVEAIGAGDDAPVTDGEIVWTLDILRQVIGARFATIRRAYRDLDEDFSGFVSEYEFLRVMMLHNLTNVREKAVQKLATLCDKNGNGMVDYEEFAKLMTSEDALPTIKRKLKLDASPGRVRRDQHHTTSLSYQQSAYPFQRDKATTPQAST